MVNIKNMYKGILDMYVMCLAQINLIVITGKSLIADLMPWGGGRGSRLILLIIKRVWMSILGEGKMEATVFILQLFPRISSHPILNHIF